MENNLDRLFRNKLSDHKVMPANESWEKLQSQLSDARGAKSQKRLAIAASVVLFLSVIGVAYYFLDAQKSLENPALSERLVIGNSEMTEPIPEQQVVFNESVKTNDAVANNSPNHTQAQTTAHVKKQPKSINDKPESREANSNEVAEIVEPPLLAQAVVESFDNSDVAASHNVEPEPTVINTPVAEQSTDEPLTVTITYKANKNSKLVTPQKANVIQEGIEKITGFAEERVFTDDLKTKLRNTTGDVLALNFGKLINKQSKEN